MLESLAFSAFTAVPAGQAARLFEHSIHCRGAGCHEIGVHQHVGQAAIAFQRMLGVKGHDSLAFPGFQPVVAGH